MGSATYIASPGQPALRPTLTRQETSDGLLSYYESSLADKGPPAMDVTASHHHRSPSAASSSSDYSSDSSLSEYSSKDATTSSPATSAGAGARPRRRESILSEGGADRRRLAIVEVDSPPSGAGGRENAGEKKKEHKRQYSGGLALVAPPDAAPESYSPHKRAITDMPPQSYLSPNPPTDSRSSSRSSQSRTIVTPEIGQEKKIGDPVASPVVVNLTSTLSSPSQSEHITYAKYQPGINSKAGPLPPPPRANFEIDASSAPPPRPPRLHSPQPMDRDKLKRSLQLPVSVSLALASKPRQMSPPSTRRDKNKDGHGTRQRSNTSTTSHRREGAFSPTVVEPPESQPPAADPDAEPKVTIIKPLVPPIPTPEPHTTKEDDEWVSVPKDSSSSPDILSSPRSSSDQSHYSASHTGHTPSPPPKSFRSSLTKGLRRMSLQRTPSQKSFHQERSLSPSPTPLLPQPFSTTQWQAPLPSIPAPPRPRKPRIRSMSPPALFCHEVHSQRTSLERCQIYAQKINELYLYDCGLEAWVMETRLRGLGGSSRTTIDEPDNADAISSLPHFTRQPRQTSRGSAISEASFPRRPDATVATDLSPSPSVSIHVVSTAPPPQLPYPSLAKSPPTPQPATTPTSKTGAFFASLGRKASIGGGSSSSGSSRGKSSSNHGHGNGSGPARLTKNPPTPKLAPSVPGGPRAPTGRVLRSQTLMISSPKRDTITPLGRRDTVSPSPPREDDPGFARQMKKLQDLLPHVERDVLAGYLRRAGQDILAIGQYLDDEKNGRVKRS